MRTFTSFEDFWPYYLSEHGDPTNRRLHFIGSNTAFVVLIALLASRNFAFLPIVAVCGYGPAWIGHFVIEKNRPATFQHPIWSLMGDFRMITMMWTGRLGAEIARLATA